MKNIADENRIIHLDHVGLTLQSDAGPVPILNDISLSLPAASTISIVGPSGSGKTTLLMLISGLEKASKGTITVAGKDLGRMGEDALAAWRRDNVGIVFQGFHLIPTMTAVENVAIPLEFAGDARAFEHAEEMLRAVGLGARLQHYPSQLSGGEQQRVAIARAFVSAPPLILADEPTGNLDAATGSKIIDLMFDLSRKRGTTLVLVTHDPQLAARCDMQVAIADGRLA